jgi:hypothetical protein
MHAILHCDKSSMAPTRHAPALACSVLCAAAALRGALLDGHCRSSGVATAWAAAEGGAPTSSAAAQPVQHSCGVGHAAKGCRR